MASLMHIGSTLIYSNALTKTVRLPPSFTCSTLSQTTPSDGSSIVPRRSANYQPSFWDHSDLLSIENNHVKYNSVQERDLLKEKVRKMLDNEKNTYLDKLELIDDLEKLGVSYHFQEEIKNILTVLCERDRMNIRGCDMERDLYATALEFRLFRQHGFNVLEDVFDVFMEKIGKLENDDINGLISLYEASYLSTTSDTKLQNFIRPLVTQKLRDFVDNHSNKDLGSCGIWEMVVQALDMPYYRRMRRLGTRLYIDVYRKRHNMNLDVMEFAKIDFNIVQAVYQGEVRYVSSWDVNRLDELPEYMRLCFLVVYNEVNSIACDILRNHNINVIPFLKKSWADVCKAYLVEAKWYKSGYRPNMEEYMQNAWISISAPTIFVHFYCVFSDHISIQVLETLSQHKQNVVRCSASVFRLENDLATSSDELARGDVNKSIHCYMNETRASEEKARWKIRQMINDMWDEMNYERMTTHSSSSSLLHNHFVETVMNLARMAQCMYQYGDGHGSPEKAKIIDRVVAILFDPIPLD